MMHIPPPFYHEGLHWPEEAQELNQLAQLVPRDRAIVEIGSYVGASTLALANGALMGHGAHVTCIDPWPDPSPDEKDLEHAERQRKALYKFRSNMHFAGWPVTALRARSQDIFPMWIQPIGLLFIDGDHSLQGAAEDLRWTEFLQTGAIIAMHDWLDEHGEPTEVAAAWQQQEFPRRVTRAIFVRTMFVGWLE